MRMALSFALIGVMSCAAQEVTGRTEEIVPGFALIESLEINGKEIGLGADKADVLAAMGAKAKLFQKPKNYTTAKLLSEADLVESLAPQFPRIIKLAREAAASCGRCVAEGYELKLGKKDVLRVALMGPNREQLRVYMIVLDQDRALIRRWYKMQIEDGHQDGAYFVTDDGTWRVRRLGRTYKLETMR